VELRRISAKLESYNSADTFADSWASIAEASMGITGVRGQGYTGEDALAFERALFRLPNVAS
jgi:hypothetical protein